jgi:hypothetical protein
MYKLIAAAKTVVEIIASAKHIVAIIGAAFTACGFVGTSISRSPNRACIDQDTDPVCIPPPRKPVLVDKSGLILEHTTHAAPCVRDLFNHSFLFYITKPNAVGQRQVT